MARVAEILTQKGGSVHTIAETASVLDATKKMNQHKVGALCITDGDGHVVGMFTERDVLRRVVAEQRDPAATAVATVMSSDVICCTGDTDLEEVRSLMRDRRIRHLPVVDAEGGLKGVVSIGDVNAHFARDTAVEVQMLHEYIHGRA